jgi:hypothetical protein
MARKYRVIFVVQRADQKPDIALFSQNGVTKFQTGDNACGYDFGTFTKWELLRSVSKRLRKVYA